MESWLAIVLFILFIVIFAVLVFIAFKVRILKIKAFSKYLNSPSKANGGELRMEDLGSLILGCNSAH